LKFSIVFGAASAQNYTTTSPSLVLITATSFDGFMDEVFLFSSAANAAAHMDIIKQQSNGFTPNIVMLDDERSSRQ